MKNRIKLLNGALALALLVLPSAAQEQRTTFGIQGGVNMGYLSGDDSEIALTETESRTGFAVGAFAEIPVHPIITLQPEVIYTQKGETYMAGTSGLNSTWDVELDYLEIPILAKVYWPVEVATRPFVYAGPFIGFNLSAETDQIYEVAEFNFTTESNLEEDVKPVESGIAFGAGIAHQLETIKLIFDIRYTQGITKTFEDDTFDDIFTGTLAGQIGVGFSL